MARYRTQRAKAGFTLVELVVVIAIIAVLATIAVPNFLESQARAKVCREHSDMRATATALEVYALDSGSYPPHGEILADGTVVYPASCGGMGTVEFVPDRPLTTPLAYLSRSPEDVCLPPTPGQPLRQRLGYVQSRQMADILRRRGWTDKAEEIEPHYGGWRLYAAGPDGDKGNDMKQNVPYDPTNGTISNGDLVRSQLQPLERQAVDER